MNATTSQRKAAPKANPAPKPGIVTINICEPPQLVRIRQNATSGALEVTTGTDHAAVWLPQFGLMFSAEAPLRAKSHADAIQQGKAVKLLGLKGWRLPERAELQLLIRTDRADPAIDHEAFPHTPTNDWYWTATRHVSFADCAWGADFGYGSGGYRRSYSGFVRAVRSVPPSQCLALLDFLNASAAVVS